MDIKNILSSVSSLVPFWATNLIEYCGLGNEYSMLFNIIIQQLLTPMEEYITETILYVMFCIFVIIGICWKNNILDPSQFKLFTKKSLQIIGSEKDGVIDYSTTMDAVTVALIEEYKMTQLIINKDSSHCVTLDTVINYKLKSDLHLTIDRITNVNVSYVFTSYNIDLRKFVNDIKLKHGNVNNNHCVHMYGEETSTSYNYSNSLTAVTYTLVHKYQMKNLINKNSGNIIDDAGTDKKEKVVSRENQIKHEKKAKVLFLIDDCKNFLVNDDIYVSIVRIGDIVKYTLRSESQCILNFIENCDNYYNININNTKYKNRLIIQGAETQGDSSRPVFLYPKNIIALNNYLKLNYENKSLDDH